MKRLTVLSVGLVLSLSAAHPALALPTHVAHADVPNCDPLFVPGFVHELGIAPTFSTFPDELISAASTTTFDPACPGSDDPGTPNALVVMTNLTPIPWAEVWYVADPQSTSISNLDGFVDDAGAPTFFPGEAFRIDTVGVNTPLVFESGLPDGIWAPGETWHFIIDDYMNFAGVPAFVFDSIGVGSASAGSPPSSGSIIAVPVPEPVTVAALALGLLGFLSRRRVPGRRDG